MNNLERDSKQYDVLLMETSTHEKIVRDSDWCSVKHVAKLSRMRGSTSTKTKIKFSVDPEEEDRDKDTTPDCVGSKQVALEDDVSWKCNCCEAEGTQWKRTRIRHIRKGKCAFRDGQYGPVRASTKHLGAVAKASVVDPGAGETVMPVDWLTKHLTDNSEDP